MRGAPGRALRWALLTGTVVAVVVVPFLAFGPELEAWTAAWLRPGPRRPMVVAVVIVLLLAGDPVLPVPSSVVGTAAGYLLGFVAGTLAALAGMTAGCLLAYALGKGPGRPLARRLVGEAGTAGVQRLWERFGDAAVVVGRPLPVLAEASAVFAGIARMPLRRFLLLTTLSNLGISAAYAAVGRFSAGAGSFLPAVAGAFALPALGLLLARRIGARGRDAMARPAA